MTARTSPKPSGSTPDRSAEEPEDVEAAGDAGPADDLRIADKDDLTKRTSRGAGWSLVSSIVVQSSFVLQAFVLPFFLSPEDYALWALAYVVAFIGIQLRDLSLGMKVVQDKDRSRTDAFKVAFTLECMLALVGIVVIAAAAPLLGALHGSATLTVLILALAPSALGGVISLPQWILMRDMRFAAKGIILSVASLVSIGSTLAAAVAGWGVWAIVVSIYATYGMLLLLLWPVARIRPGFAWDRAAFRQYLSFGWPLWAASLSLGLFNLIVVNALAWIFDPEIVGYYQRVWTLISASWMINMQMVGTLYPAVVRVGLQIDVLRRTYVVVNRLVMTMLSPIAGMLAVFGSALVMVWGPEWEGFGPYLQVTAAFFVFGSLAIDWENYYRAKGDTKPMLVVYLLLLAFLPIFLALVIVFDEPGIWVAIVLVSIYLYAARSFFAQRLLGRVSALRAVWAQLLTSAGAFVAAWGIATALDVSSWTPFGLDGEIAFGLVGSALGWVLYVPLVLLTQRKLAGFTLNAVRGRPTGGLKSLLERS